MLVVDIIAFIKYTRVMKGMLKMKKTSAVLLIILLLCGILNGCSDKNTEINFYSFSFAEVPVENEKPLKTDKNGSVTVVFDVPETGLIKLLAFDNTDYDDWQDEETEIYVDFINESGNTLYKDIGISNGYIEKYKFDAGKVTAKIIAANKSAEELCLSWAYAADNYESAAVGFEEDCAAVADENGTARFSLCVDTASLIRIFPAEACVYESDCSFYVETSNGEKVTDELNIHGTEWTSRLVFLEEGEYSVVVNGVASVALCGIKIEESYAEIQLDNSEGTTLPVVFGFNAVKPEKRSAKFTADGSEKYLVINARGEDTYYDSVHYVEAVITDASGNVVARSESDVSDETITDISSLEGEYTVTISAEGSCAVEISVIEK